MKTNRAIQKGQNLFIRLRKVEREWDTVASQDCFRYDRFMRGFTLVFVPKRNSFSTRIFQA
jgi:hypothetical protein